MEFSLPDGSQHRPWHTSEALADLLTAHAAKTTSMIGGVDRFDHPDARTIRPRWTGETFSVHGCVQALFTIRLPEARQHDQDRAA